MLDLNDEIVGATRISKIDPAIVTGFEAFKQH